MHLRVDDLAGSSNGVKLTGGPTIEEGKRLWWDKSHSSVLIEDIFVFCSSPSHLYLYYYWDKKEEALSTSNVVNDHKEYDELVGFLGSLVHKVVEKVGMTTVKRKKMISQMISQKMSQIKNMDKQISKINGAS